MKRIIIGRTINDVRKILCHYDVIFIRAGFNSKFKKFLGFVFIPEYFKLMEVENVFFDIKENERQIFLTV